LGYIFLKGDTLVFQARSTRLSNLSSLAAISDTMTGLQVNRKRSAIYNRVRVTTHPRIVDTAATTVLFSLSGTPEVGGGWRSITLIGQYRDPNQMATRCGGRDMVTPAATTDYLMNSASDGSGTNLTSSFSVTANYGGNGVELVVTNNGSITGYITKLQCRGRGIYDYGEIISEASNSTSKTAYGENVLEIDMPMQADQSVGQDAADFLLAAYKDPRSMIEEVEFFGNRSAALMTAALVLEPGDRVTIAETMTGVNADYTINAVSLSLLGGQNYRFAWTVTPVSPFAMWLLGTAGASEIGTTTVLGY
jgi:hypothetical protein